MANKPGKGILLTTKFYKSANDAALLDPDKRNKEGKADAHPERMAVNKQENTTTKNHVTENSRQRDPHKVRPFWRRQDVRGKESPTLHRWGEDKSLRVLRYGEKQEEITT